MRTHDQINKIKQTFEEPFAIKDFLTKDEIDYLINLYMQNCDSEGPYSKLIHKNTGPITLDLSYFYEDSIIKNIFEKLQNHIGNFKVTAAFFFKTDFPHIIHNDDTHELPDDVYKGITIPLHLEGFSGIYPKLCFFNQFYFHGPAKFFKDDSDIPTYYNKQIYEYSQIDGLSNQTLTDTHQYFTHLKPKWLEGLSLNSVLDWIPGDALLFDSLRLHCASDFRKIGIKSKLGISIFTKKN